MVTTIPDASMASTGKEDRRTGHQIIKPTCISEYNKYMKGVGQSDQYLANFSIFQKTRKWYKKVGFYLSNCGLFSAFKIYCSFNAQNKMTYKQFLLAVAGEWVTDHAGECSGSPAPSPCGISKRAPHKDPPCRLSGKIKEHILEEIIPTGLKKKMLPESVESALPGESAVKPGIFVIDVLFPCTEVPDVLPITR